jgi:hypothetical protein
MRLPGLMIELRAAMRAYFIISALAIGTMFVLAHTASVQDRILGFAPEYDAMSNGIGTSSPTRTDDYDDED